MGAFWERHRLPLLLGLFLMVVAAYFIWGGRERVLPEEAQPEPISAVEEPAVFTVRPDSHLIYQVTYSQCGHGEVLRRRTPSDEIGLTLEELQAIYLDWNIEDVGLDVILTSEVEGLCEDCRSNIFVGIHEGRVAVFFGQPGGESWLKEVTELPIANLPPREQADLERGIPVENEKELLHILEGLMN
ncbi:MAG: hypothetical protein GX376_07975 [Firmicutes bacterium]|nr:hypothetical protein [Bacillota bacterium]